MYKYKGKIFIVGIPARDLTNDEYETHSKKIKKYEKAMGVKIYSKVEEDKKEEGK